jgi:anti-anti-sigma regulatory factor
MREVKFVDSYVIGLLVRLHTLKLRVDSLGVRLVAVVSSDEILEVFRITKMDRIIMVRNDFDPPAEPSAN